MLILKLIVWIILFKCCLAIKVPKLKDFKYGFIKYGEEKKELKTNPLYLLVEPEEEKGECKVAPKEVNVINNNDLEDLLSNVKTGVFRNDPTLLNFHPEFDISYKNEEENKLNGELLKMSQLMLLADKVVVPVDYEKLTSRGCSGVKELKLMGLGVFTMFLQRIKYPKFHFVIYNYEPLQGYSKFSRDQNEFIRKQKYEIQDVINEFLDSFTGGSKGRTNEIQLTTNNLDVKCDYVDKYKNIGKVLKESYQKDRKYYESCVNEIEQEFKNKVQMCENIERLVKTAKETKGTRLEGGEIRQIEENSELYGEVFKIYQECYKRFIGKFKSFENEQVKLEDLKRRVDGFVNDTIKEYEGGVSHMERGGLKERIYEEVRFRLVEDMRKYLYMFNQEMIIKMMEDLLKKHEEDLRTLKITNTLDDDLASLISKYDGQYCSLVRKIRYKLLEGYDLYEAMTKSMRLKMAENIREYSNRIMENVIKAGLYYHKFSIVDGIRFIPNERIMNLVQKIINKIKIPINLRVSYLSPNAFGLSNLFRSKDARGPNTYLYFTGKDRKN